MTEPLVGPFDIFRSDDGTSVPWYVVPFDENGECSAPETRFRLLQDAALPDITDVFLFSHGWNNIWPSAIHRYREFIEGYVGLRRARKLAYPRPVKPLLIGIFWPSADLVLPWEEAPTFAPFEGRPVTTGPSPEVAGVEALLSDAEQLHLRRFVRQPRLDDEGARELAALLAEYYRGNAEEDVQGEAIGAPTAGELVELWRVQMRRTPRKETEDTAGYATATVPAHQAQAAGPLNWLDPRLVLRLFTVLKMKDRAGVVGHTGIGPLLGELMSVTNDSVRFHLIGHSYGSKVLLSAVCAPEFPSGRFVTSMLLLQPAVSHLCFAQNVQGTGVSGGYRAALQRVRQPILTTFSAQDLPLRHAFQLAVRRKDDVGELQFAAAPSAFAALGGYGPGDCLGGECRIEDLHAPGVPYDLSSSETRVLGLDASGKFHGHSDVSNEAAWWALYCQASSPD